MIRHLGMLISRLFRWLIPDPFVIAILLTLITVVAALVWGRFDPEKDRWLVLLDSWRDNKNGIWKLLAFSMQMCLILVTGHALAAARPIRWCIDRIAGIPGSTMSAVAMVGFTAMVCGLVNWGLGLIVGALLARDVGRSLQDRGIPAHYPLIAASGYMGMLVWHGGFSGSAPLAMTSEAESGKILPEQLVAQVGAVPLEQTILSPLNLIVSLGLLALVPMILMLLSPRANEEMQTIADFEPMDEASFEPEPITNVPRLLNRFWPISWMLAGALLFGIWRFIDVRGFGSLGLDEIIMIMFAAGLVLHGSPVAYMHAATNAARGCSGIMIQFPLYAGIMALMVASGLMAQIAEFFVEIGDERTMPLLSFVSAAIVNIFVPSGGGQWIIQGPIALESGLSAGVSPGRMIMAVAYGDELTNMLQPFWALPLLAITGVKARDIVGYTAMVMVAAALWIAFWLLVWS
ncbi:MAG: hypothetical protein CMJ24_00180 [Phycisphaerae bacterium]|nr:hypothetical protein [Phycisphaerae bacterium]